MALFELTFLLDFFQHLESARDPKQGKEEYFQVFSELYHLGVTSQYNTIEISILGHYLPTSSSALCGIVSILFNCLVTKSQCRKLLDDAAEILISFSREIFLARDCSDWSRT